MEKDTTTLLNDIVTKLERLATIREQEAAGLWNLQTAAKVLGLSESNLKEMAQKRKIPCFRPSKRAYVFNKSEVLEWLKSKRVEAADDLGKAAILESYMNS